MSVRWLSSRWERESATWLQTVSAGTFPDGRVVGSWRISWFRTCSPDGICHTWIQQCHVFCSIAGTVSDWHAFLLLFFLSIDTESGKKDMQGWDEDNSHHLSMASSAMVYWFPPAVQQNLHTPSSVTRSSEQEVRILHLDLQSLHLMVWAIGLWICLNFSSPLR